eukprot:CAMPEP_0198225964 /NCGR_PEP_ID=MMETSP1445-20131203/103284_1 /TAXON_ID=36898 /ORGANISM="Pyramimonas sp., Strain CCMP2087" /LENGTH=201 /DNA_ID=CAMNT_0043905663 /DNA_START=97 /DNA_END=700 /DNA_ORIENTATION=+
MVRVCRQVRDFLLDGLGAIAVKPHVVEEPEGGLAAHVGLVPRHRRLIEAHDHVMSVDDLGIQRIQHAAAIADDCDDRQENFFRMASPSSLSVFAIVLPDICKESAFPRCTKTFSVETISGSVKGSPLSSGKVGLRFSAHLVGTFGKLRSFQESLRWPSLSYLVGSLKNFKSLVRFDKAEIHSAGPSLSGPSLEEGVSMSLI